MEIGDMSQIKQPVGDFHAFFEECLRGEKIRPAEEGERDPQLVGLVNSIMNRTDDFVLVDYGCGLGPFIRTLNNLNQAGIEVLDHMHYIGVDVNREYLVHCNKLAKNIKFKQRVRRFQLCDPLKFWNYTILVDYVFLINTLHEISPRYLDKHLSDLLFKLNYTGSIIIHELKQLLLGEKDFITYDEEDIMFLFGGEQLRKWASCNIFPFRSKRTEIEMYNAHIVRTKAGFVPMEMFSFELEDQFFELLYRKNAKLLHEIENFKNKDSRRYAYLITLYKNVSKGFTILEANKNIWERKQARCYRCGSRMMVKFSDNDMGLGDEAILTCPNCGLKETHFRWKFLALEADKNYKMLKRYFRGEFEKKYHYLPAEDQLASSLERIVFNTTLDITRRIEAVSQLGELQPREDSLAEDFTSSLRKIAVDSSLEGELRQEALRWLNKEKESIDTWPDET